MKSTIVLNIVCSNTPNPLAMRIYGFPQHGNKILIQIGLSLEISTLFSIAMVPNTKWKLNTWVNLQMVHTSKLLLHLIVRWPHQFNCYRESIDTLLLRIGFSTTLESIEHTEKEWEIESWKKRRDEDRMRDSESVCERERGDRDAFERNWLNPKSCYFLI